MKDTYNLLADGIKKLLCRLAEVAGESISGWAEQHPLSRYVDSSSL